MLSFEEYVVEVLMRDLVGHDRKPVCFLVYLWLAAEEQKRGRSVQISYQDLAESVGVSKSSAQSAVAWLARRKLLEMTKETATATPTYKALTPWKRDARNTKMRNAAHRGELERVWQEL